jgi:hypothetical protein
MKTVRVSRVTAVVSIVSAVIGLLISVGGLVVLWANKAQTERDISGMTALVGRTLEATRRTVDVTAASLEQAGGDLDTIHAMLGGVSVTLQNSTGMIDSTSQLVGVDLLNFITSTQTGMSSVQTSARFVDDFLRVLNRVPFLGGNYAPAEPLQDSIARVSRSLEGLPEPLKKISGDLKTTRANADTLRAQVDVLTRQIADVKTSLSDAQSAAADYQAILADAQQRFDRFNARLPGLIDLFYGIATLVLAWMLLSQVAALLHGIQMLASTETGPED